jgi:flap endonuclease-1
VDVALLVGTDYTAGIKGVGPKRALEFVKKGMSLEEVFKKFNEDLSKLPMYYEAKEFFLHPEVKDVAELEWREIDAEGVLRFLHDEHDFSAERVTKAIQEVEKKRPAGALSKWF